MKTKSCTKCGIEKELNQFHKHNNTNDGYRPNCKKCHNNQIKNHRLKYPWKRVLESIKQRCNNPKNIGYKDYGEKGIKCLITVEELKFLWFRDKAYKMQIPTIDRIDNDRNYILSNCRFIEKSLNSQKDKFKQIIQYTLNNELIQEFKSIIEASKKLNLNAGNISQCCKGNINYNSVGGYKWRYK